MVMTYKLTLSECWYCVVCTLMMKVILFVVMHRTPLLTVCFNAWFILRSFGNLDDLHTVLGVKFPGSYKWY